MANNPPVRTTARELALLILYAYEMGDYNIATVTDSSWLEEMYQFDPEENYLPPVRPSDRGIFHLAEEVSRGVLNEITLLDKELTPLIKTRSFERVPVIDKIILRLGTYLLIFDSTIPKEAVFSLCARFADLYSEAESAPYIQGILSNIAAKWRTPHGGKNESL
jgi:N utilization substance protein B